MDDSDRLFEALGTMIETEALARALCTYEWIQKEVKRGQNFLHHQEFKACFQKYYKMHFIYPAPEHYFRIMQEHRDNPLSFEAALCALAKIPPYRCEASFASKLAATLNPSLPVLDENVFKVLRKYLPERGTWELWRGPPLARKLESAKQVYADLYSTVLMLQKRRKFSKLMRLFDREYGERGLTNVKKLDLMMWRLGAIM